MFFFQIKYSKVNIRLKKDPSSTIKIKQQKENAHTLGARSCIWQGWWRTSSYLNSDLWEVHLHGEFLTAVHVWVVGLLEGTLQLMQLVGGEGGAVASVLLLGLVVLARFRRLAFIALHALSQLVQLFVALVCEQSSICSWGQREFHWHPFLF